MSISRRDALMGATAAAVVTGAITAPLAIKAAGVEAALAGDPDAALLAQVAQFHEVREAFRRAWQEQATYRAQIGALPECPKVSDWRDHPDLDDFHKQHRAQDDFLSARGVWRRYDEANKINDRVGSLVNAVFETPAQTAQGVLEKVHIMYIARGDFDEQGDNDLEVFQDDKNNPWFGAVIADLERLAGEVRS